MRMHLYDNQLYQDDINYVGSLMLPWEVFRNKSFLISGATGMVGSFLIDVLLSKNIGCTVYALGRDERKALFRFSKWKDDTHFRFIPYDINQPLVNDTIGTVDYVIHLASNTHPMQYSTDPIGTVITNVIGLKNMLDFAVAHNTARFVFASSNEIYGENRGDTELFKEDYCGYINSNTLRAGYPESKRCGEALCQAYRAQKKLDVVIPRPTRSYGPTMLMTDTKAISQFVKNGVEGKDIILKSEGNQLYSYTYVADTVSGFLTIILKGETGEAYNIADERSDIKLKDLAKVIADLDGRKVIFQLPDSVEAAGYSKATKARLDGSKLMSLGWTAKYDIESGMKRTISVLREIRSEKK